jgi:hypothetical protein
VIHCKISEVIRNDTPIPRRLIAAELVRPAVTRPVPPAVEVEKHREIVGTCTPRPGEEAEEKNFLALD